MRTVTGSVKDMSETYESLAARIEGPIWATDLVMAYTDMARPQDPFTLDRLRARARQDDARCTTVSMTRRPVPVAVATAVVTAALVRALLGWRRR